MLPGSQRLLPASCFSAETNREQLHSERLRSRWACRGSGAHSRLGVIALSWLLPIWSGLGLLCAAPQTDAAGEYRYKARFLANSLNFVEWPADAFLSANAPLVLGVYGDFRFGTELAEMARKTSVHGHSIEIRWIRKNEDLRSCHILFVSRSEEKKYAKVLDAIRGMSVLTVGETASFLDAGGAVELTVAADGLHFQVNLAATDQARLKVSSHLLALAQRVVRKPPIAKS